MDYTSDVHAYGRITCERCSGTGQYRNFGPCYRCTGKGHTNIGDRRRNAGYDRHRKGVPGRFNR